MRLWPIKEPMLANSGPLRGLPLFFVTFSLFFLCLDFWTMSGETFLERSFFRSRFLTDFLRLEFSASKPTDILSCRAKVGILFDRFTLGLLLSGDSRSLP